MRGPDPAHPFAFVADLEQPVLDPGERHHLERVRRLKPGAAITVGDGSGRFRRARFGPALDVDGPIEEVPRPRPPVSIGFALTKGSSPELVVRALTEIGVDEIVPFVGARSITRWDDAKAARNVDRWRSIAREACAQAHRPHLPTVTDVQPFGVVAEGAALAHWDGDGPPGGVTPGDRILVGPEGGWSPAEAAAVRGRVLLGPHVLRAETAAIVAGALAVAARTA